MHGMGKDKGENERGDFGLLVPMERKLSWEVKEVKKFLLGKKKHLNVLVLGFEAMKSSFPRIYEISCISPTPPVKKRNIGTRMNMH